MDKPNWTVVDDEFRTGVATPEWWSEVEAGKTVFVSREGQAAHRVKDASLREHARRTGKRLHTRASVMEKTVGTVYWMTDTLTLKSVMSDHDHPTDNAK